MPESKSLANWILSLLNGFIIECIVLIKSRKSVLKEHLWSSYCLLVLICSKEVNEQRLLVTSGQVTVAYALSKLTIHITGNLQWCSQKHQALIL